MLNKLSDDSAGNLHCEYDEGMNVPAQNIIPIRIILDF
jgi:hypothetical protein